MEQQKDKELKYKANANPANRLIWRWRIHNFIYLTGIISFIIAFIAASVLANSHIIIIDYMHSNWNPYNSTQPLFYINMSIINLTTYAHTLQYFPNHNDTAALYVVVIGVWLSIIMAIIYALSCVKIFHSYINHSRMGNELGLKKAPIAAFNQTNVNRGKMANVNNYGWKDIHRYVVLWTFIPLGAFVGFTEIHYLKKYIYKTTFGELPPPAQPTVKPTPIRGR